MRKRLSSYAQYPAMKGALRTRAKGVAIRMPATAAAKSMLKIALSFQDIFPSPTDEVPTAL